MNKMHIFYNTSDTNEVDEYKFTKLDKLNTESKLYYVTDNIFSIPAKYYGIFINYEFTLIKKDNKYYISDLGKTYKMLDKLFELNESDVVKNLNAIMKECRVLQYEDEFIVEINAEDENINLKENEATYRLLECVSFMDTMQLFYT